MSNSKKQPIQRKSRTPRRIAVGLAALAGIGFAAHQVNESTRNATYEEALSDPTKRQAYARSLLQNKPNYVDIEYMPTGLLDQLKGEGYELPFGAFAITVPHERNPFKIGGKSTIILTDECFALNYRKARQAWTDIDLLVRNVVENHEKVHAHHYHEGILGYDIKDLTNSRGELNEPLFKTISELLAHVEENKGLKEKSKMAKTGLLENQSSHMVNLMMMPHYVQLSNPQVTYGMNPAFIQRLQRDLHPKKLLQ